ncbi:MAG: hypothetical protein WCB46_04965 [Methanoregula sp.]
MILEDNMNREKDFCHTFLLEKIRPAMQYRAISTGAPGDCPQNALHGICASQICCAKNYYYRATSQVQARTYGSRRGRKWKLFRK